MDIAGYTFSLIMGVILGLLGGGGSILTVPIMVYAFGVPALIATSYSLMIVGVSSLIGVYRYAKQGLIRYKLAGLFLVPSILGVLISRLFLLPSLPETLHLLTYSISQDRFILLFFAFLCLVIAFFMFRSRDVGRQEALNSIKTPSFFIVGLEGLFVGMVTGFVGAGGGFMIVPALCLLCHLSIKEAIASSLFIISLKSLIGFLGDLSIGMMIEWILLSKIVILTLIGVFIGTLLNQRLNATKLRQSFAYFIILMAIFMIFKEGLT